MRRKILSMLTVVLFASSSLVVASVAVEKPAPAVAWHWENWVGDILVQPDQRILGQGFCYGPHDGWGHPYWFDGPDRWIGWGHLCNMMLKFCTLEPVSGGVQWRLNIWKAHAWFNERYSNNYKWADRIEPWHSFLVDAQPSAQQYCAFRYAFNYPYYF